MASGDNERHQEDIFHDIPPADATPSTFIGAVENICANWFADKQFCCLGKIEVYDREKHIAIVQPMVKRVGAQGHTVDPPKVVCTVRRLSACGYLIDIPINVGDTGWVIAADVDTEEAKKSKEVELPPSMLKNQFRYGFFIPDAFGERPLNDDDKENNRLVISTDDGRQRISMGQSDIRIVGSRLIVDMESIELTAQQFIALNAPSIRNNGKVNMKPGATGAITMFSIANVQDGIVTGIYPEPEPS